MKPVTALTGANETFKRERLGELLKKIPKDEITTYYAGEYLDEKKLPVIFSQCRETGLFGQNNVVIIKDTDEFFTGKKKDKDEISFPNFLEKYLENFNPDTSLILIGEKPDWGNDIKSRIEEIGEIIDFKQPYESDILNYARKKLRDNDIAFEADLPEFIHSLTGNDIEQVEMMMGLIINFCINTKTITVEEARTILSNSHNLGVFDLIDGIFKKDVKKAVHALWDLKLVGEALIMVNAMVLKTSKNLWNYLATKETSKTGRNYFLWEYSKRSDLKFVSTVLDTVKRVELRIKSVHEDLAFIELEKFILSIPDVSSARR